MELRFIVSGVPAGENLWGEQKDDTFLGTMYVPSKQSYKFDIRLNKSENAIYAYYHYLVYNNINDFEGRDGSYIGLTVRIDRYCTDYKTIYNVLDTIYRKKIIGTILQPVNGGRYQYTCQTFEKKDSELKEIEKFLRANLGTVLVADDFKNIPSLPNGKGQIRLNPEDANEREVMNAVGQNGSCSISSEYESRSSISIAKEEFKKGSSSRQQEINSMYDEIEKLKKHNGSLENQLVEERNKRQNNSVAKTATNTTGHYRCQDRQHLQNYESNGSRDDSNPLTMTIIMLGIMVLFCLFLFAISYFGDISF